MEYLKRICIKIPNHIDFIHTLDKNLITLQGPIGRKSFYLPIRVIILKPKRTVVFTITPTSPVSNKQKKQLGSVRGTYMALVRQFITEITWVSYTKLKFIGVGYRSFYVENFDNTLLLLKLGFSHFVYFKVPDGFESFCIKFTKLFVFGNLVQKLSHIACLIRSYKAPEPYKGKGIRYLNENIELKIGKRTNK